MDRSHTCFNFRNTISKEVAALLLEREILGLGIDTLSADLPTSRFPVHQLILGAGKYLVENVANAKPLSAVGSAIFAIPIKISKGTKAPIRLFALRYASFQNN